MSCMVCASNATPAAPELVNNIGIPPVDRCCTAEPGRCLELRFLAPRPIPIPTARRPPPAPRIVGPLTQIGRHVAIYVARLAEAGRADHLPN